MTESYMDTRPLVSVIIPTYNRIGTLPRAIDSVLGQTYENLELIVVDDGSTDGTEAYVRGLTDRRVRYIKGEGNKGPAAARNRGVKLASGEYVAFQDSDDEWHSDKLEKQMPVLLDSRQGNGLVYCEFTRHHGPAGPVVLIPSKKIPLACKQGNIQAVLLLQPLIGTPTMVVRKEYFLQTGGFDERLKTFEDYEFTVRFSQRYSIGFVEEVLVKVNDLPDSVDKRFADRIHTQAYIVRKMIGPLREYGILWDKLSAVQETAEHLKCHEVFLEELKQLEDLFITEQDRENAARLTEKTEQSDVMQNRFRENAYEALTQSKQRLVSAYMSIYREEADKNILHRAIRQAQGSMADCEKRFGMPAELRCACGRIYGTQIPSTRLECLSLLTDVVRTVEELEKWIEQQIVQCNVCGGAYFKNKTRRCPFCEAEERERLLIAFLEELQPESGEFLNMLQMMPSRLLSNYVLKRMDIQCDNLETDDVNALQELAEEHYDILICPALLKCTDHSASIWRECYRIMKSGGVCLVSKFPDDEEKQMAQWLETLGFCVSAVGESWFGTEFYRTYGFDSQMTVYGLTKGRALTEM